MSFAFLNNTFLPTTDASLGISDLSIQRGYGIFDYFKTIGGRPIFLDDHLDRFYHSAARMHLAAGKTREELKAIIAELQQLNQLPDSGIRITLTGGYSPDSISPGQPNLIITQHPLIPPRKGCPPPVRLISHPYQRQLPDVKTIDYLMALYLQPDIRDRGAFDVLYHHNGIITECPRCNFFLVTADDTLVTPARNMLMGITRMKVLEFAYANSKVEERDILLAEIPAAKEAFFTSTSRHIVPVSHLDDIPIGGVAPGPDVTPGSGASRVNPIANLFSAALYELVNT